MSVAEYFPCPRVRSRAAHVRSCLLLTGILLAGATAQAADPPGLTAVSLAPRSGPPDKTMFTLLPPDRTGIHAVNHYDDPKMWGDKFREFTYGSVGTGISIGDFDGDGRPDVFVVCKTGPNHLFRNLGDFHFEDVTERAGVAGPVDAWKQGSAFVDINNDGLLDIYVCRFNAPNLLYINQGDGTFKEMAHAYGLDVVDACVMAAFCDYDRDGLLDVFIQTNLLDGVGQPKGRRDYLFHNRGDGTFENVTDRAGIFGESQGHSATWWDYDNDGWPDLYVANDFAAPDQLYHNNGDGTFTCMPGLVLPHIPWFSMGTDLGDVNNDGLIDLFVAEMLPTTHEKDHQGMIDMRVLATTTATEYPGVAPQYMRNALFLNTGTGLCQEAAYLTGLEATDWTWSPRLEDLDNDGRLDLHVTNGMVRDYLNANLMVRQENAPNPLARERLIIGAPELPQQHLAFRNLGDLRFENVSAAWGLDQTGISTGSAFGDLDGDGDLDLVYANYNAEPSVYRNDGTGGHRLIVALRGTTSNRFGVGATVRIETAAGPQVRQLVLARGYDSTSEPILHFGLGDDALVRRLTVNWPSGKTQVFENLPADQRLTVTEPAGPAPRLAPAKPAGAVTRTGLFAEVGRPLGLTLTSHEQPFDELAAQPLLPMRHNRLGPGVAVGDLNGDGIDDVCLGGAAGEPAQIMVSAGPAAFRPAANPLFASNTVTADATPLIFDADGDGINDLFMAKGGVAAPAGGTAYQPHLYLGRGDGTFAEAPADALPDLPISAGPVCAADFNHDGQLDLFMGGRIVPGAYPLPPRSALLLNQGGKFVDVTDALAPGLSHVGMVTAALWTDVDGDGWPDLLIALDWGGIRCWHNDSGHRFEDWTHRLGFDSAGSGWWNSLVAADFNGDGRLDYVAGNLGLNTKYHATPEHPAVLYSGVFEEGGTSQLIEGHYEGDRLFPFKGRKQIAKVIPSILKKFPANPRYAAATLDEIFSPERLQAAQRFAATEFQSGLFLSQPDGSYRFQPLPRPAQLSPIYGMAAGDFDGDGKADLYVVQNSYAPVAETGRFDGGLGLFLRGDGRGNLTPVPALESGLIVPGDAKGLAVSDFDGNGWPDFLITRNNDITLAYLNRGAAGRNCFGISLRGPKGNPTAVGALITVVMTDGSLQTAEVHAGGGYLSQSSAVSFFGYPQSNPPKAIRVRWPLGGTTTQPWPGPQKILVLSSPAG